MGRSPSGFAYEQQGGDVVLLHHGRRASVLRGRRAEEFLAEVEDLDPASGDVQLLMARLTGSYKFGNERTARQHPRNRGR